ncbi:MAG TPA: hypothetical protein VE912_04770, partial [Bacteroidales bacterium]|nr:hypothetical protein [Bacteroidales bacterium]
MINNDKHEIQFIISELGIKIDYQNLRDGGWYDTWSPFRQDKHPSFSINVDTGNFIDRGADKKGNLVELVKLINRSTTDEAIKWLKEKSNQYKNNTTSTKKSGRFSPTTRSSKKPTYTTNDTRGNHGNFWDEDNKEWLRKCRKKLHDCSEDALSFCTDYDLLYKETLEYYECGLNDSGGTSAILMSYETGCQIYTRDENNKKVIRQKKGSKPSESFYGTDKVQGNVNLAIAKSPREAMLLSQENGDQNDVISISSGEQANISKQQSDTLSQLVKKHKYKEICTFFDQDTEEAKEVAQGFAQNVKNVVGDRCEVYSINIQEATDGECKDVTDAVKAGLSFDVFTASRKNVPIIYDLCDVSDKGKVVIKRTRFLDFLNQNGFCRIPSLANKITLLVHIKDHVIDEASIGEINKFTMDYLESLPEIITHPTTGKTFKKEDLKEAYLNKQASMLTDLGLQSLPTRNDIEYATDDPDSAYIFPKNQIIKIKKDDISSIDYAEFDKHIWADQIIDKDINILPPSELNNNFEFNMVFRHATSDYDGEKNEYHENTD